jgi:hypothetical protein
MLGGQEAIELRAERMLREWKLFLWREADLVRFYEGGFLVEL